MFHKERVNFEESEFKLLKLLIKRFLLKFFLGQIVLLLLRRFGVAEDFAHRDISAHVLSNVNTVLIGHSFEKRMAEHVRSKPNGVPLHVGLVLSR